MIGREQELQQLEELFQSDHFEFLIMYGRRRIGKTTILQEFAGRHRVMFFSAQEKNDALNLTDFSRTVQKYHGDTLNAPFRDWESAFRYAMKLADISHGSHNTLSGEKKGEGDTLTSGATGDAARKKTEKAAEKQVLIIDEFPFLAAPNPSVKSILQHLIDHDWKNRNLLLILCGSSVSFMVNDVMGYKSPLYGRTTATREVLPFDYLESAAFFPDYSVEEKLIAYGILGGVPRYLAAFDKEKSIVKNVEQQIVHDGAFLNDEPLMLLRMELREPGVYNSILEAVANGANKLTEIADRIREERSKCSKYIATLQSIRLLEKKIPCGEPEKSKKGIYALADHYYCFWYRFIFTNHNYYTILGDHEAAAEIMEEINDYMGPVFEDICRQYIIRQAKKRKLPFIPAIVGKWWGTNPVLKRQDDIDVVALDKKGTEALFCECKFRNHPMPMEEYDDLLTASQAFPKVLKRHFCFISKSGFTDPVRKRAREEGVMLVEAEDLFR